jgi:predicted O-methyltransferase YrrM
MPRRRDEITKAQIEEHPSFGPSLEILRAIESRMVGGIAHEHVHVLYVLRELMGDKCKTYLEIGVGHGGSMLVAMASKHPCKFIGVDVHSMYAEGKAKANVEGLNVNRHPHAFIEGKSQDLNTGTLVEHELGGLGGRAVDLLFIDGSHATEDVINDAHMYIPLVRHGGIVVFDDHIAMKEVAKAIDQIVETYPGAQFWNVIGNVHNRVGASSILFKDKPKSRYYELNNTFIIQK